jgi:hypothetical protein
MSTILLSTISKQLITVDLGEEGIHAQLEELHVNTVLQESANGRGVCYLLITRLELLQRRRYNPGLKK